MKCKRIVMLAAVALIASGATFVTSSPAAAQIPEAPWAGHEVDSIGIEKQFPPVVPRLGNRPSILLETDFYVYGPGTGFARPEVNLTTAARGYNQPTTLWLYWENRVSGAISYYSLRTGDFGNQPRDLFGVPGSPAKVRVPTLDNFNLFGAGGALGQLPGSVPTATGAYQFVFEVRDGDGNQVIARGNAMYNNVDGVVGKAGTIGGSETWTRNNVYFLQAPVNVTGPAVLTIQAGTVILGSQNGQGTLVIRQGARINAVGTSDLPIIMTSELEVGQRNRGDWGGLVINGNAPTNQANPQGEGNSGPYGGNNAADNSGTLRYVRVEYAGILFSDQNELNGIALQGVGNGTTIDHIQIHRGLDDGLEFFGGTADAKFVLVTDARDDSVDWTFGWTGRMQHVVVIQRDGQEERGIEADNDENNNDGLPRSAPKIANATFICNRDINPIREPSECIRLRRGTAGNFTHLLQQQAPEEGIRVTEDASIALIGTELTIQNSFFFNNGDGLTDNPTLAAYLQTGQNNNFGSTNVPNGRSLIQPDVAPTSGAATNIGPLPAVFLNDPFFDSVRYAGGVNPNDSWIDDGWTTFSDN